ncbi:AzlC family ABC transporter permease [Alloscardovia criceti]|uniref:AzlC family ABC transporter permease n=1 Tax=Alloscardovia criceti TaxID=356828 RepID=UPI000361A5E1|nr:AzlC family ABC transporter permease [Alloscardovia criceti]
MENSQTRLQKISGAAVAAFPLTIPIGFAWLFLGMSYGLFMSSNGFNVWYTALMASTIYAGSLEFVIAAMLLGSFQPLLAFVMALMVNARHLFYGLAMLKKYHGTGKKKWYLIFGLTDETFALASSASVPQGVDRSWFYFFITFFNQCYWVLASVLGSLLGSSLDFNTKGINFVLTAMFATIFLEEWLNSKRHASAAVGILLSVACLLIFGSTAFLIPTMASMLAIFGAWYLRRAQSRRGSALNNLDDDIDDNQDYRGRSK